MASIKTFNLVREDCASEAQMLFEDEQVILFPTDMTRLDSLLVWLGVFKSLGEARRNGFSGDIPKGWFEKPKGNIRMWIWNPTQNPDDWFKDNPPEIES